MISQRFFKIDENHTGLEVSRVYKELRFPVELLAKGRKYDGVEISIDKPHGKKKIMQYIIKLLLKGPKQYKSFVNHVLEKYIWQDLNDALEILLLDGVIQITFKNQKPRKAIDWFPKIIQLDSRALEDLKNDMPDDEQEFLKLKNLVKELLSHSNNPLKSYLLQWIQDEEIKDQSGEIVADSGSFKKYKSIILILAYYINLKDNTQKIPIRHLSNQTWNNPKILNSYKNEVIKLTGIKLEELNSVLLPDINGSVNTPLIIVPPIEELENLIAILTNLIVSEFHRDEIMCILDKMDYCTKNTINIIGINNDTTENFLNSYKDLKECMVSGNSVRVQFVLGDFVNSTKILKNSTLKIEAVRQQFELVVLKKLGNGSFATVYEVFDPESNQFVACKVLFPRIHFLRHGNDGDEYISRFKREVKLLSEKLNHKNIIQINKIHLEGSPFWFTMPVANYTLDEWLKNNPDASEDQRVFLFKEILSGVEYLHENNKYHRDLAPKNILLFETNSGLDVKIADFGLAKDPESLSLVTVKSKRGYGHEEFTDPQQLNNLADSTNLSDIYSLGALLYYLLSGKSPKKRKYVHVRCQEVIMKAMDKRHQRYQSVYEFKEELVKYYRIFEP